MFWGWGLLKYGHVVSFKYEHEPGLDLVVGGLTLRV